LVLSALERNQKTNRRLKFNPKFRDAVNSPLMIEVVETPNPGAYDLNLTT
jgi:hypothetical protein